MNLQSKYRAFREIWQFDNRWYLLFTRLFFRREATSIYNYRGYRILTDHSAGDANGAREVITSGMYRQYLSHIKTDREINVLDIGANNGGFPLLLAASGLRIKKLACVEMNPLTFTRLRFNVESNFDCTTILSNTALCGSNRAIRTRVGVGSAGDNIYANSSGGREVISEGLSFNTLYDQTFCGEKVDICKIDVEAAEFEVFASPEVDAIRNCRYLLMEIHHEDTRPRELVQNRLAELGFSEVEREVKSGRGHFVHLFVNDKK